MATAIIHQDWQIEELNQSTVCFAGSLCPCQLPKIEAESYEPKYCSSASLCPSLVLDSWKLSEWSTGLDRPFQVEDSFKKNKASNWLFLFFQGLAWFWIEAYHQKVGYQVINFILFFLAVANHRDFTCSLWSSQLGIFQFSCLVNLSVKEWVPMGTFMILIF